MSVNFSNKRALIEATKNYKKMCVQNVVEDY